MDANAKQIVSSTLGHGRDGPESRPDGRLPPFVAVKSVPGRDTSHCDVRRRHRDGNAVPNDVSV